MRCVLRLDDLRDLTAAVARCRRLLDLDADPVSIAAQLEADPVLGELAARAPRDARARLRRRLRARRAGDRRPAGLGGRRAHRARAAGRPPRRAAARAGRRRSPTASRRPPRSPRSTRTSCRSRAGAREALRSLARLVAAEGLRFDAGADAVGRARRAARHPGRRPLDGLVRRDARARRPGRVPARRRRHPPRAPAARPPRRGAAATALAEPWRPWRSLRGHAPLGEPRTLGRPASRQRAAWWRTRPTRLPSAMFASTRCRPQVGVGRRRGRPGAPPSGSICSTLAPPAEEQRAR